MERNRHRDVSFVLVLFLCVRFPAVNGHGWLSTLQGLEQCEVLLVDLLDLRLTLCEVQCTGSLRHRNNHALLPPATVRHVADDASFIGISIFGIQDLISWAVN